MSHYNFPLTITIHVPFNNEKTNLKKLSSFMNLIRDEVKKPDVSNYKPQLIINRPYFFDHHSVSYAKDTV